MDYRICNTTDVALKILQRGGYTAVREKHDLVRQHKMNLSRRGFELRYLTYRLYLKFVYTNVLARALIRLGASLLILFLFTLFIENLIVRGESYMAEVFYLAVIIVVLTLSGFFGLLHEMRMEMWPLIGSLPFEKSYWLLLDSAMLVAILVLMIAPFSIYLYFTQHILYILHWPLLLSLPLVLVILYYIQLYTDLHTVLLTCSLGVLWALAVFALG